MKANDPKREQASKWSEGMRFIVRQTRAMTLALRHPAVPWHAKIVAACSVGYLLSPIQLIPTFIPIIGQFDDLAVLFAGMKLLRALTPREILEECETQAVSGAFFARPLAYRTLSRHEALLHEPSGLP